MYKLEKNTIYLTRGDTLQVQLNIMQDDIYDITNYKIIIVNMP